MADKRQKQSFGSYSSDAGSLDLYDSIKQLAESGLDKDYLTYDELLFKLRRWWCQYYKRPYKDPLLDNYTLEELMFEYFDITHVANKKPEETKIAEKFDTEDRDWAAEEEARELAEQRQAFPEEAPSESDIIVEEAVGLTDQQWADKYDAPTLTNPSADQVDGEDGDISATFEG